MLELDEGQVFEQRTHNSHSKLFEVVRSCSKLFETVRTTTRKRTRPFVASQLLHLFANDDFATNIYSVTKDTNCLCTLCVCVFVCLKRRQLAPMTRLSDTIDEMTRQFSCLPLSLSLPKTHAHNASGPLWSPNETTSKPTNSQTNQLPNWLAAELTNSLTKSLLTYLERGSTEKRIRLVLASLFLSEPFRGVHEVVENQTNAGIKWEHREKEREK